MSTQIECIQVGFAKDTVMNFDSYEKNGLLLSFIKSADLLNFSMSESTFHLPILLTHTQVDQPKRT